MTAATVLVADDSLVIRAVVSGNLEAEGYRVVEAADGLEAVDLCLQEAPDVVLLDVEMPGLDGYEVLARLKGDPRVCDVPVVFLTSKHAMEDVVSALRGGAHDYLRKPFEPAELLARVASALHVKRLQDQLRQRNAELDRLSRTDALTGLFNRRHLDEQLSRLHGDSIRHRDALCVVLLDLDHFKRINDTLGHPAGDQVLRAFADRLRSSLRAGDVVGRWGGEEFLVILPRTDLDGALAIAERIRSETAAEPVAVGSHAVEVTISAGVALGPGETPTAVVQAADACLYRAKAAGRNRVTARAGAAGR